MVREPLSQSHDGDDDGGSQGIGDDGSVADKEVLDLGLEVCVHDLAYTARPAGMRAPRLVDPYGLGQAAGLQEHLRELARLYAAWRILLPLISVLPSKPNPAGFGNQVTKMVQRKVISTRQGCG